MCLENKNKNYIKNMKFKIGDKVRKIKGYKFEGIIIGGGHKLDGERTLYMVEIPNEAITEIICVKCSYMFPLYDQNCNGMVHIFAESDIELIN